TIGGLDYQHYDSLLQVKRTQFYFNRTTSLTFALLTSLALYVEYLFSGKSKSTRYFYLCHDLYVLNLNFFVQLNFAKLNISFRLNRPRECVSQCITALYLIWHHGNRLQFCQPDLVHFPKLSNEIRAKAVVICALSEVATWCNN